LPVNLGHEVFEIALFNSTRSMRKFAQPVLETTDRAVDDNVAGNVTA